MAPQPTKADAPKDRNSITAPGRTPVGPITAQDRLDNDDAQIGSAEDPLQESGETLPVTQNQPTDADPLGGGVERREPIRRSQQDDVRSQIAARFRRTEPEDEVPFNGDMSDPSNIYGEFGRAVLPEQADAGESVVGSNEPVVVEPAADQPAKRKVKVRGREMELTDDEILEAARKTLAGDSYMDEARAMLEAAKDIRGQRGAQDRQPPGDTSTQDDLSPPDPDQSQPQEISLRDVVEKIQFGDPDEAAAMLDKVIDSRAAKSAKKGQLETVFDQDLARSQKALKKFQEDNPEIAADEEAAMLIQHQMYQLYRKDMQDLGLDDNQIPKNNTEAANWHRFYRVNGYEVRTTAALLEAAKQHVAKRLGIGQQSPSNQQLRRKEAPRVQVNVNRDERRLAIPVQPQRGSTPRRDVQPAAPAGGSAIVAQMRKSRGQV